jgi:hypothetical protein
VFDPDRRTWPPQSPAGLWRQSGPDLDWTRRQVLGRLAGPCATLKVVGSTAGCEGDFEVAGGRVAALSLSDQARDAFHAEAADKASSLVYENWSTVELLAEHLCRAGRLDEHEIKAALREHPRGRALLGEDTRTYENQRVNTASVGSAIPLGLKSALMLPATGPARKQQRRPSTQFSGRPAAPANRRGCCVARQIHRLRCEGSRHLRRHRRRVARGAPDGSSRG